MLNISVAISNKYESNIDEAKNIYITGIIAIGIGIIHNGLKRRA
jgi:hypothetical protein